MEIRLENISKNFGSASALKSIDLTIRSGELLGLLGPSGSGKTTLLRLIAGLETPSNGKVFFGTENASHKAVQERRVGFVFQNYALFKHLNVFENIAYGLRVRPKHYRPHETEIARRVGFLLDLMQLGSYGDRYPSQLSGGQKQRVALARALAVEPRVLLLDEPFGALDAAVRRDLRRWLRSLHDKTGHTTVFVTHDQDEALELSDRVAVLNRGSLEQIGTADEIYDLPASPFVFNFIGDSSRVAVSVENGFVTLDGTRLPLTGTDLPDGPAFLFARPQDVTLAESGQVALHGLVAGQRRVGPVRRLEVAIGAARSIIELDLPSNRSFELGRPVSLALLKSVVYSDHVPNRPALVETNLPAGVLAMRPQSRR